MTYFHKQGSIYRSTAEENILISKTLPIGTYSVMADMQGFYFEPIPDFEVNGKIYGETTSRVDRVINTFNDRPGSTGVILQGEKGSGKTMFARLLSSVLNKQGVITLVVNTPFAGESFNNLINSVTQPCVIIFDEFEKVYDSAQQQKLLTLLDGTYQSKKLFVVTCNEIYRVSEYMKNRPGRFFYSFQYDGLSAEFVREYCQDCLKNKDRIESVVTFSRTFSKLNFDILKAIVEEMNRYDEPVGIAVKYLNATPMDQRFKLELYGIKALDNSITILRHENLSNFGNPTNPFVEQVSVNVWSDTRIVNEAQKAVIDVEYDDEFYDVEEDDVPDGSIIGRIKKDSKKKEYCFNVRFRPENLQKMENGMFFFVNDKFAAIFKRKEEDKFDIQRLIA